MSRTTPRQSNRRAILWIAVCIVGFIAAIALSNTVFALLGSLALLGALVSIRRFPRVGG
jgi:4-hydroxybenzoate polyprenyltransferase